MRKYSRLDMSQSSNSGSRYGIRFSCRLGLKYHSIPVEIQRLPVVYSSYLTILRSVVRLASTVLDLATLNCGTFGNVCDAS